MIKYELPRFIIVGLLTVGIDWLVYSEAVISKWLHYDTAKAMGFLMGTFFAYVANHHWTFKKQHHTPETIYRFIVLYALTLGVNVGVNALALHALTFVSGAITISFLLATGTSASLNFIGMKYIVFK